MSLVPGAETGGAYVEGKGYLRAGGRPPGIHRHRNQDEQITVLAGRIRAKVGDDEREFGPEETAFLPRGSWHDFWVVGDEPAELVVRVTPALGIELLLGTLAGLAREGKTDKHGRPRPLQGAVIGDFYEEVAQFKTPPPAVQRVVLPVLAAVGRRRGLRPYYERHFEPGEIEAVLAYWAAHRPWAGNRPPE
ncbi:MAG TPA: cupin domain-containing protein [Acidimicrobiales bacterium]|nr:cupin domain-containing protein [Acidimicrobiales bacterium]